ncbi:hypothetical protein SUDANB1_05652 [Streptomyces sp. enrichment culture]|uniref:hypothetical protein n=1 Tax=Streptomyces sp. enrichment culture TaxID=1795815 RepID=UPI003F55BDC5
MDKQTYLARRKSGGFGTGEGHVGLVDQTDPGAARCTLCGGHAVLYFVETAEGDMLYACLADAAAVAYDVAVASTAGPDVPASERGADDRRRRSL